jgi:hypothetical protein
LSCKVRRDSNDCMNFKMGVGVLHQGFA